MCRLGKASRSPRPVTATCFTPVSATIFSRVAAKFSRIRMASAPESTSWCLSSRGVYSGFTFTTVMPARRMPNSATGYCSTFGSMIATRDPGLSPTLASQPAKAADSRSSSP